MAILSRREMLKAAAGSAAMAGLGTSTARAAAGQASDIIRLAVVGLGGRGKAHIRGFRKAEGVEVVALCDADTDRLGSQSDRLDKATDARVGRYTDYRLLLERGDIDAVSIATPNHQHAVQTILALQAGKHVYTEKPVCHNVWEGRQIVEAMRKHDRVVAGGFQNRSDVALREGMSRVHREQHGPIKRVHGFCYRQRASIGKQATPLAPPSSVDYDLWLGPAADQAIMRPRFHYDWHWDFNTGNGDMGNQGPHELDMIRWALGDPDHPSRVRSFGGRFGWDDAGNTFNMQCAAFDFGSGVPVTFEVRNLHQKEQASVGAKPACPGVGILVECEGGTLMGKRGEAHFTDKTGAVAWSMKGDSGSTHYQNFVDAVRSNQPETLRSTLESAFRSSCVSHLANISVLTGGAASEEAIQQEVGSDPAMTDCLRRYSEQLDLWQVDREQSPWSLGPALTFDAAAERFTAGENHAAANRLLRREDREGHEVPEIG